MENTRSGDIFLYSSIILKEIGDKNVIVIPRDTGSNDPEKLSEAIKEIKSQGANIVIGPVNNEDFDKVKKFNEMVFISLSNIYPKFKDNVSIGISLESKLQL